MTSYVTYRYLGSGASGDVFEGQDTSTGQNVAIKRCFVGSTNANELKEAQIMNAIGYHPNLITLKEAMVVNNYAYYIIDLMKETLLARIESSIKLDEYEVRNFAWQMLQGVAHIHRQGFMHRDLKPENILLNEGKLKIADFGVSSLYHPAVFDAAAASWRPNEYNLPKRPFTTPVGTRYYTAPEILSCAPEYGPEVDMWSIGCIIAELITGKVLFQGPTQEEQLATIKNVLGWRRDVSLRAVLVSASPQAIDLVARLVSPDPKMRPTAETALKHEFFEPCRKKNFSWIRGPVPSASIAMLPIKRKQFRNPKATKRVAVAK